MVNKFKLNSNNTATKETITRTLEIADRYAGELTIEILPLDKIELDPNNNRELALTLDDARHGIDKNDTDYERKKKDWKSLESLAKTIQEEQLINPIFVYRFGNKCRLISGERRTLACAIAGKNEIIARIANQRPVGTKLRVLQWIENNERADLSLAERIGNLEAIITEYLAENNIAEAKITAKLLSNLTGMSMTQTRRYILILHSNPEIKNAIIERKLENIKLIEFICSIKNVEHQSKILKAAISGLSFEAIMKLKKELDNNQITSLATSLRKRKNVSLGSVRTNLVKILVDALMASNVLDSKIIQQMHSIYQQSQWEETKSAQTGFKKIMLLLESNI